MKLILYDAAPGPGAWQAFLRACWIAGAVIQKLLGKCDAYYGAATWAEARAWLLSHDISGITSLQFFGHGDLAQVFIGGVGVTSADLLFLKSAVTPRTVIWFRGCSVFQGSRGHLFSQRLANGLGCTIAGHTRITGPLQPGLHSRTPNTEARWPETEGETAPAWVPLWLKWVWPGPNTVTCLATRVPEGW